MKFLTLLKKEMREMLSVSTIIGMVVAMGVFFLLGQVMTGISQDSENKAGIVHLMTKIGPFFLKAALIFFLKVDLK